MAKLLRAKKMTVVPQYRPSYKVETDFHHLSN